MFFDEDSPATIGMHEPFYVDLGGGRKELVIITNINITQELGRGTTISMDAVDWARFVKEHTIPS